MISVVIPLYNKEAYISNTIRSVLRQSFTDFELLIVNDGSTDNSCLEVGLFTDERIRLINKKNEGVSIARNKGIFEAKNPWIAFLDADDWWEPTFLEEIAKAINAYSNENIFVTGRSRVFQNKIERYENPFLPKNAETGRVNYFKIISKYLPPINSSNVVIKKELLVGENLFREGMKQHEDHDLWIRLCQKNQIIFVNKELSFYRRNIEESASEKAFSYSDFKTYVYDISEILKELSVVEKKYFRIYFNKFIPIRYFQSYYGYSYDEKKQLMEFCKGLLSSKSYMILKALNLFSFINGYKVFKNLKG